MTKELSGFIIIALLVAVFFGLQFDDNLEPAVQDLIDKTHQHSNSNAYIYIMGIYAAADDDPEKVGQKIYQSILQGEEKYLSNNEPFAFQDYPNDLKLPLPEGDAFCSIWAEGCIKSLFLPIPHLDDLLESNSILLQRYAQFNTLNDYATLSRPMISEPMPPYQYISRASRLVVLNSIKKAKTSNHEQAIALLRDNILNLRRQLARQDTLIGKMIFLMQISENLDVAYLISRDSRQKILLQIPPLTKKEKDIVPLIARELSMAYDTYRSLDGHPEFLDQEGEAPGWYVRIFFKPNMTLNATFPFYKQVIKYGSLSHIEFAKEISRDIKPEIGKSWLRNSAGSILNEVSMPNYHKYIARFFDLDTKILLFNSAINNSDMESIAGTIANPYYQANHSAYLSEDKSSICFDGPLPDERKNRCLRIKI